MMPGAAHDPVPHDELPIAKRRALVRAGVVDREEIIVGAEHRDRPMSGWTATALPGGRSSTFPTTYSPTG